MAVRCDCVIRGMSSPLLVEVISSMDEALGEVVPIPTWADVKTVFITSVIVTARGRNNAFISVPIV